MNPFGRIKIRVSGFTGRFEVTSGLLLAVFSADETITD